MTSFKLKLQQRAFNEIQNGIDYYNIQQKGFGKKFYKHIKNSFVAIEKNPFYQIRYDNVRCFPVKKFPFMIHFTVDETNNIINVQLSILILIPKQIG